MDDQDEPPEPRPRRRRARAQEPDPVCPPEEPTVEVQPASLVWPPTILLSPAVAQLHARASLGLQPPRRPLMRIQPEGVVLHCSDGHRAQGPGRALQILRVMQADHLGRGWADVGYSHAYDDLGHVYTLRGWGTLGAHTAARPTPGRPSLNYRAHGFCYLGDGQQVPDAAIQACLWLIAEHDRRYGRGFVIGHRDVARRECPGDAIYERVVKVLGRPLS